MKNILNIEFLTSLIMSIQNILQIKVEFLQNIQNFMNENIRKIL